MKIIYIKKIEELHDEVEKIITKQNPTKHKGLDSHLYGVEMEKEIANFLQTAEGRDILDYMHLQPNEINKIVYGKELSFYTSSKKIDILIITDTKKIGISCKTSRVQTVGVLEIHGNTFYTKCKDFLKRNNMTCMESNLTFFPFYDENGRTIKAIKKADNDRYEAFIENINQDWKKLLQFCIQGEDINEKIEFLFFYDKDKHFLYVSNINDYLDLIEKYGTLATMNSRMNITSTSNKGNKNNSNKSDRRIKFKMQNPIHILKKNNLI